MSKRHVPIFPGAILADAMYTMPELCARLNWDVNEVGVALKQGLRSYMFCGVAYAFGSDVMRFIKECGETQERGEQ